MLAYSGLWNPLFQSFFFFFLRIRDLLEREESSNKHFNMRQHHGLYPSLSLNHDLYKKSYLLRQAADVIQQKLSYFLTEELHFTQKLSFLQLFNSWDSFANACQSYSTQFNWKIDQIIRTGNTHVALIVWHSQGHGFHSQRMLTEEEKKPMFF